MLKWVLGIPTQALMLARQALYSTEASLQPLVGICCSVFPAVSIGLEGALTLRAMFFIRADADAGTEVDMG